MYGYSWFIDRTVQRRVLYCTRWTSVVKAQPDPVVEELETAFWSLTGTQFHAELQGPLFEMTVWKWKMENFESMQYWLRMILIGTFVFSFFYLQDCKPYYCNHSISSLFVPHFYREEETAVTLQLSLKLQLWYDHILQWFCFPQNLSTTV